MSQHPSIGISYSWKEEDSGETAGFVETCCQNFKNSGFEVVRDRERLKHCDSIERFMREISSQDIICIFLSDNYFLSKNCLFELFSIWERLEVGQLEPRTRVKIFKAKKAKIFEVDDRLRITAHWQAEATNLGSRISDNATSGLANRDLEEYKRFKNYADRIGDILAEISDLNLESDLDEFIREFEDISTSIAIRESAAFSKLREVYQNIGFEISSVGFPLGVDLIITKSILGMGTTRIGIRFLSADLNSDSEVSSRMVKEVAKLEALQKSKFFHKAVIVIDVDAIDEVPSLNSSSVEVKTLQSLEMEILNLPAYLKRVRIVFEEYLRDINYLPGRGSYRNSGGSSEGTALRELVNNWIDAGESRVLWILGDFGTGKTSFLQSLFVSLSEEGRHEEIPFYIQLSRYSAREKSQEFLRDIVSQELGNEASASSFEKNLRSGNLIILCDGFDEMGEPSNEAIRRLNYSNLLRLSHGAARIIVTCRPSYFIDDAEFDRLCNNLETNFALPRGFKGQERNLQKVSGQLFAEYFGKDAASENPLNSSLNIVAHAQKRVVDMALFSEKDIRDYLCSREDEIITGSKGKLNSDSFFELLQKTYDLSDLASRPILLSMIVGILPGIADKISNEGWNLKIGRSDDTIIRQITPSVLYWVQTDNEFSREQAKGRSREISSVKKREILERIAYELFRKRTEVFDAKFLASFCKSWLHVDGEQLELVITELRSSSFFKRVDSEYKFVHKSFLEFFAACHIGSSLASVDEKALEKVLEELFSEFYFPEGLVYFLGDLISVAYTQLILPIREVRSFTQDVVCLTNALNSLNFSRNWNTLYERIDAGMLMFTRCDRDSEFKGINAYGISFKRCEGQFGFENCSFKEVSVTDQRSGFLKFKKCNLEELKVRSTSKKKNSVSISQEGRIRRFSVSGPSEFYGINSTIAFTEGEVSDDSQFTFKNCIVVLPQNTGGMSLNVSIRDSFIFGGSLDCISPDSMENCVILGATISNPDRLHGFSNCSGFAFSSEDSVNEFEASIFLINQYLAAKIKADFLRYKNSRGVVVGDLGEMGRGRFLNEFLQSLSFNRRLVYAFYSFDPFDSSVKDVSSKIEELRSV